MRVCAASKMTCGVVGAVFLACSASAEALNSGGGHKFVSVGKKSSTFEKAQVREVDPCDVMSASMAFCREDTDWAPEVDLAYNNTALYKLDDTYLGAMSIVPLSGQKVDELTADDLDALLEEKVFLNGPRGERQRDALLGIERDPSGKPKAATALVTDQVGNRMMLQVSVFLLNEGVGFVETTAFLGTEPAGFGATDKQRDVHADFLKAGRIRTEVGSDENE